MLGLDKVIEKIVDRIPDPNARKEAKEELETRLLTMASELTAGQLDINKAEAQSGSLFVAGWRPAIGWVGALALGWTYIVAPLTLFGLSLAGRTDIVVPEIMHDRLWELVWAILGLGGMRTYEKLKNVAR